MLGSVTCACVFSREGEISCCQKPHLLLGEASGHPIHIEWSPAATEISGFCRHSSVYDFFYKELDGVRVCKVMVNTITVCQMFTLEKDIGWIILWSIQVLHM